MKKCAGIFAALLFALAVNAQQAQNDSVLAPIKPIPQGKVVFGVASFYSKNLQGTKTSTGERFSHDDYTGASNSFKLNTWVRVTNLRNGKSVIVRINDRMGILMAKKGRVVDLTITAAKKLDFIKRGLTRVKVEEVAQGTLE
jgi:rare lipoprotein A